ncbi:MAG: DUF1573 domain-containing protein [Bacteroidaceae bacterium]|nr:DUF1573 domain-containing protein [Bacteroidaceae bacterium]
MKKTTFILAIASLLIFVVASQMHTAQASTLMAAANEEPKAEIKFDTLRIDLGTFSEKQPEQHCTFTFTNVGEAPLIINQAFPSCGCTVPTYTKDPVKPGEKGQIDVTYNGKGKFPGHFTKTITIRSNAKNEIVRLAIEGTMTK